jgi:hypothetical protein
MGLSKTWSVTLVQMRFSHNITPNHFGAFIFVGSPGSKPEHGQHLQQPEKTDQDSVL